MAVVGHYFCARPVLVSPCRVEISPLTVEPQSGGESLVRWADGTLSQERAARFSTSEYRPDSSSDESELQEPWGAPAGWVALVHSLGEAVERRLKRDAAAWGFGLRRGGGVGTWSEETDRLLLSYLSTASPSSMPARLAGSPATIHSHPIHPICPIHSIHPIRPIRPICRIHHIHLIRLIPPSPPLILFYSTVHSPSPGCTPPSHLNPRPHRNPRFSSHDPLSPSQLWLPLSAGLYLACESAGRLSVPTHPAGTNSQLACWIAELSREKACWARR